MRHLIFFAAASITIGALAQDLHTEITVDRTVLPVLRDSKRLNGVNPSILTPEVKTKQLHAAEYTEPGMVTSEISILPQAQWPDSIANTDYRGYASVGYFPLYNLGINAGYRLLDTRRYGLGLWMQYDGNSYNGDIPYYDGALFTNHTATVGGNAHIKFGAKSMLSASGHATLSSVRHPYYYKQGAEEHWRSYGQGATDVLGKLSWQSRAGNLVYDITGSASYFGMNMKAPRSQVDYTNGVRQAAADLSVGLGIAGDDAALPWIGINADLTVLRSTHLPWVYDYYKVRYITQNLGEGHIRPYLRFDNDVIKGSVGFNLSIAKNYHAKTRIAPEASICWTPAPVVSMYANVKGGEYINRMSDIFEINPYIMPGEAYGRTNIPLAAQGGINIGRYDGMSFGIYGGYAMARDYMSPLITLKRSGFMTSTFYTADVNSWLIGANLGFSYMGLFRLAFDICTGGADKETHSWYEWIDAPKVVSKIELTVTPVDNLTVNLGYETRYDRKARTIIYELGTFDKYSGIPNLGTINNVTLGGNYRVTPALTAFLQVDNLINCRYKLISGMPAQGVNGLLGVALKF